MGHERLSSVPPWLPKEANTVTLVALCLFCILAFVYVIVTYSVNVPVGDDVVAVLRFMARWDDTDLKGKLALLFGLHNEHRIAFPRLTFLLDR